MINRPPLSAIRTGRWLPWALLLTGGLLLVPLATQPKLEIALVAAVVMFVTASISVAVPLGLTGFAPPIVALLGHDPFPGKAVPLITFAWLALAVAFTIARRAYLPVRLVVASPLVLCSIGLFALMLARLPASTDASYGAFKIQLFVIGNLALLAAGIFLGTRPRDIDLFLILTLAIDAISGLLVIRQFGAGGTGPTDRFGLPLQSVLALGVQGAEGLMIATYFLIRGGRRSHQMMAACLLPISLVALLASGSRGPVLGGAAGLVAMLVLLARMQRAAQRLVVVVLLAIGSFALVGQLVPSSAVHRSLSTITGTHAGLSSNGRNELWSAGWRTFGDHPVLGVGTGSFATVARRDVCPGPGCRDRYPHNILLETAAELGIAGLALMIGILVTGGLAILRAWRRFAPRDPRAAVIFGLFVSAATTAMLTNDITGHGSIWLMGGIGLGLTLARPTSPSAEN
jgi:O-antigen ligase